MAKLAWALIAVAFTLLPTNAWKDCRPTLTTTHTLTRHVDADGQVAWLDGAPTLELLSGHACRDGHCLQMGALTQAETGTLRTSEHVSDCPGQVIVEHKTVITRTASRSDIAGQDGSYGEWSFAAATSPFRRVYDRDGIENNSADEAEPTGTASEDTVQPEKVKLHSSSSSTARVSTPAVTISVGSTVISLSPGKPVTVSGTTISVGKALKSYFFDGTPYKPPEAMKIRSSVQATSTAISEGTLKQNGTSTHSPTAVVITASSVVTSVQPGQQIIVSSKTYSLDRAGNTLYSNGIPSSVRHLTTTSLSSVTFNTTSLVRVTIVGQVTALRPGQEIVTNGKTVSLAQAGNTLFVNGLPTPVSHGTGVASPTVQPVAVTFAGHTTSLRPGQQVTVGSSTFSLGSAGQTLWINGSPKPISPAREVNSIVTPAVGATIAGKTTSLRPGQQVTVNGKTFSLGKAGETFFVDGRPTSILHSASSASRNPQPVRVTIAGSITSLRPGQQVTVRSTTYSLGTAGWYLYVDGKPTPIAPLPHNVNGTTGHLVHSTGAHGTGTSIHHSSRNSTSHKSAPENTLTPSRTIIHSSRNSTSHESAPEKTLTQSPSVINSHVTSANSTQPRSSHGTAVSTTQHGFGTAAPGSRTLVHPSSTSLLVFGGPSGMPPQSTSMVTGLFAYLGGDGKISTSTSTALFAAGAGVKWDTKKFEDEVQHVGQECKSLPCTYTCPTLHFDKPGIFSYDAHSTAWCKTISGVTYTLTTAIGPAPETSNGIAGGTGTLPATPSGKDIAHFSFMPGCTPPPWKKPSCSMSWYKDSYPCEIRPVVENAGKCGQEHNFLGAGICPGLQCCGQNMTCGTEASECGTGCQRNFGQCWPPGKSSFLPSSSVWTGKMESSTCPAAIIAAITPPIPPPAIVGIKGIDIIHGIIPVPDIIIPPGACCPAGVTAINIAGLLVLPKFPKFPLWPFKFPPKKICIKIWFVNTCPSPDTEENEKTNNEDEDKPEDDEKPKPFDLDEPPGDGTPTSSPTSSQSCTRTHTATRVTAYCSSVTKFASAKSTMTAPMAMPFPSATCGSSRTHITSACSNIKGTTTTTWETCSSESTVPDVTYLCDEIVAVTNGKTTTTNTCTSTISSMMKGCDVTATTTTSIAASCPTLVDVSPDDIQGEDGEAPSCPIFIEPVIEYLNETASCPVMDLVKVEYLDEDTCPLWNGTFPKPSPLDDQGTDDAPSCSNATLIQQTNGALEGGAICPAPPSNYTITSLADQGDYDQPSTCTYANGTTVSPDDDQGQDGAQIDFCAFGNATIVSPDDDQGQDGAMENACGTGPQLTILPLDELPSVSFTSMKSNATSVKPKATNKPKSTSTNPKATTNLTSTSTTALAAGESCMLPVPKGKRDSIFCPGNNGHKCGVITENGACCPSQVVDKNGMCCLWPPTKDKDDVCDKPPALGVGLQGCKGVDALGVITDPKAVSECQSSKSVAATAHVSIGIGISVAITGMPKMPCNCDIPTIQDMGVCSVHTAFGAAFKGMPLPITLSCACDNQGDRTVKLTTICNTAVCPNQKTSIPRPTACPSQNLDCAWPQDTAVGPCSRVDYQVTKSGTAADSAFCRCDHQATTHLVSAQSVCGQWVCPNDPNLIRSWPRMTMTDSCAAALPSVPFLGDCVYTTTTHLRFQQNFIPWTMSTSRLCMCNNKQESLATPTAAVFDAATVCDDLYICPNSAYTYARPMTYGAAACKPSDLDFLSLTGTATCTLASKKDGKDQCACVGNVGYDVTVPAVSTCGITICPNPNPDFGKGWQEGVADSQPAVTMLSHKIDEVAPTAASPGSTPTSIPGPTAKPLSKPLSTNSAIAKDTAPKKVLPETKSDTAATSALTIAASKASTELSKLNTR
ncbi:hypothetical protein LTR95_007358 [Oleoguttula sp. CCFEE 5521]